MKKIAVILIAAILMLAVVCAGAETAPADLLSLIRGKTFDFTSGVGAWYTELTVGENGTFMGSYHDSEMGETGEGYPDGTVYGCLFHGQFSDPVQADEYSWTVKVTVEQDEGQAPETIEDGMRFVTSPVYGLEKAQTVTVYLPGTPVDKLPEDFMFWSHLQEIDPEAKVIPYYAIWSEADAAGFITEPGTAQNQDMEAAQPVTAKDLIGSWRVCYGTDGYDTLVFHEDGTMEAYDMLFTYAGAHEKGLLLFYGEYRIDGTDVILANNETYHIELAKAPADVDYSIGNGSLSVDPGDMLLTLYQDPADDMQIFGGYVQGYYYPGTPAEEYLANEGWLSEDGKEVTFEQDLIEYGRIMIDGAYFSVQCQLLPASELSDAEREKLDGEELLLYDENAEKPLWYLSDYEIIAYPLGEGAPMKYSIMR